MLAPVLLLAALSAAPPAATPSVELAPAAARPGDVVLVRVRGGAEPPRASVAGRPLVFWRAQGEWRALAPLPVELAQGPAPVEVDVAGVSLHATLDVVDPGFRSTALSVAPAFVEPPPRVRKRVAADRAAFAAAWQRAFSPPLFEGGFVLPRDGGTSGRFGDQRVLNGKAQSVHYGLDLRGPRGAPVAAANDGIVVLARDAYMSGRTVVLWHGSGVFTVYFHLDRVDVKAGQRVARGARVGLLGSTGRSTGPHLHWGARVDGLYVDPESLVAIDFGTGTAPPRAPGRPLPAEPAPPEGPPAELPAPGAPALPAETAGGGAAAK